MTPGKRRKERDADWFADWGATVRSVLFDSGM